MVLQIKKKKRNFSLFSFHGDKTSLLPPRVFMIALLFPFVFFFYMSIYDHVCDQEREAAKLFGSSEPTGVREVVVSTQFLCEVLWMDFWCSPFSLPLGLSSSKSSRKGQAISTFMKHVLT